jgi:type VI secretion system secreted protein Hcp
MEKKKNLTRFLLLAGLLTCAILVIAGDINPTAPPGPTMHTLDEIYNAVTAIQEPPAEPFAFNMFLTIEGIQGESSDERHQDWIEILFWQHGVQQSSAGIGPVEHQDFSVTKYLDKATPKLALYCCSQSQITQASLELCKTDSNDPAVYTINLYDLIITSVTPSGSVSGSETLPVEEVSFNYGKIEWEYLANDGNTIFAGWDVNTNTPVDPCGYLNPAD